MEVREERKDKRGKRRKGERRKGAAGLRFGWIECWMCL